MAYTKSKGYKKTKTYKEIRSILCEYETPWYCDNTVNGVSFKWYIANKRNYNQNFFTKEFIKEIFPSDLFNLMTFKYLDHSGSPIKDEDPDWIEKVFGKRDGKTPRTFRVLVNLEGAE